MKKDTILLGKGSQIIETSQESWRQSLASVPHSSQAHLRFMSRDHHRVRNFVVLELVRSGAPVSPERIVSALELPPAEVALILDELEQNLFFLVRDESGAVAWAFPFTVQPTPHSLLFSSGEKLFGA